MSKKLIIVSALTVALCACGGSGEAEPEGVIELPVFVTQPDSELTITRCLTYTGDTDHTYAIVYSDNDPVTISLILNSPIIISGDIIDVYNNDGFIYSINTDYTQGFNINVGDINYSYTHDECK